MRTILSSLILFAALAGGAAPAWSAAAAAPGSIAPAPNGITYFARAGDTLSSIAQELTGKRENWALLGKLNRIGNDSNIPIGTALLIPAELLVDEASEAKVAALSGSVTAVAANGGTVALAIGAKITQGMQIDTGNNSFVTLSLPDGSRISLPSNSRVKIAKLRITRYTNSPRTEVTLLRGRVESRVTPLEQNKGSFEVRTPLAVAGVRGTHFRVGITENGSANEVLSGHVAVGTAKNPAALTLNAGQGNLIDAQAVGKPVDLLPAPRLANPAGLPEYSAAQLTLTSVAGATAYHVQISTDQEGQNILSESRASGTTLAFDGVPAGNYFVRMAAIDKSGLEGLPHTQAFKLKTSAEASRQALRSQSPPSAERSGKQEITLRWVAQLGQAFTVQVARDPNFSWLLLTTHTATPEVHLPRPPFGTYYARVQAIDADGKAGAFSSAQSFIVTDQWVMNEGGPISVKENPSELRR